MKQPLKSKSKLPIKLKINDIYYNYNKFYSYPDLFIGFIDGGRGIGKTTSFCIKGFKESEEGNEFIYLRRYKPEIKKFVNKDSFAPIIDGIIYKGDGTGGYTVFYGKRQLGYLISLSTARSYKSTDFSKVTLIIYDEGFVHQTASYRYLQDEIIQFLEFISTVVRTRKNVKVVILGNHEDMFSPYHSYFNIPAFTGVYIDKEHGIYCEHAKNSAKLLELERQTGLHKLIKDTAYGGYHYDNEILGTNDVNLLENKPNNARFLFRFVVNKVTLNIYTYEEKGEVYMYVELKEKRILDRYSYEIINEGKFNYFNIDIYKKRFKNYIYNFYFNNRIYYSEKKGGTILAWMIENT